MRPPRFRVSTEGYGSPRIHEDLIEQDEHVSRERVIRFMQGDGLVARARIRMVCGDSPCQPQGAES